MRTGFLISENTALLNYLSIAKEASDLHTNIFSQYVIWDYLQHNDLEAHIAKIKDLYQTQAQAMLGAMEQLLPGRDPVHQAPGRYVPVGDTAGRGQRHGALPQGPGEKGGFWCRGIPSISGSKMRIPCV